MWGWRLGGIHAHRWSQSIIPLSISCAGCCSNRGMHISPRCLFSIIVALRCSALFCAAQRAHTLFPDIVRRYRKKKLGWRGEQSCFPVIFHPMPKRIRRTSHDTSTPTKNSRNRFPSFDGFDKDVSPYIPNASHQNHMRAKVGVMRRYADMMWARVQSEKPRYSSNIEGYMLFKKSILIRSLQAHIVLRVSKKRS